VDAAGNVYIVDNVNYRIRKVTAATGIITTVAGNGTAGSSGDGALASAAGIDYCMCICVNAGGDVFFADQNGAYIRMISATTGLITLIAGNGGLGTGDGGPALLAGIGNIYGICCDCHGDLYINDWSCSCRKINMSTTIINTVAGDLWADGWNRDGISSTLSYLNFPIGVCVDVAGNIYIADKHNFRIRKAIQLTHTPSFAYGKGQTISTCPGAAIPVNDRLSITDMDLSQTETWTVISGPVHGTLSGFPYSMASVGTDSLAIPSGLSYIPSPGYTGTDYFLVRVTDGSLADTIKMFINITPAGGVIYGTNQVCLGGTLTLDVDAAGGTWSSTHSPSATFVTDAAGYEATITGMTAGIDTLMYTNTTSCGSGIVTKIVSVDAIPDAGTITGATQVVAGHSIILADTSPGGVWSSGNDHIATVSGAGIVYGLAQGGDSIIYTITNLCGSSRTSFTFSVLPDHSAGVNSVTSGTGQLIIAPNPANGQFTVNLISATDESVIVTITNIAGEKIKEITGYTNQPIAASLNAPAGIYLLNVVSAHEHTSSKIVIE